MEMKNTKKRATGKLTVSNYELHKNDQNTKKKATGKLTVSNYELHKNDQRGCYLAVCFWKGYAMMDAI
jgi:hypothetical protein